MVAQPDEGEYQHDAMVMATIPKQMMAPWLHTGKECMAQMLIEKAQLLTKAILHSTLATPTATTHHPAVVVAAAEGEETAISSKSKHKH
jgi:hypothetical protein